MAYITGTNGDDLIPFSNVQGQLGGVVEGDINGDSVADFAINILGAPALIATDFVL